MARLSGVDLPREKRLEIALTYIYGIGPTRAAETLTGTGVSGDTRVHALADDDLQKLREWIDANYQVEGDLRREVAADIRRKIEIGCYQGIAPARAGRRPWPARRRSGRSNPSRDRSPPKEPGSRCRLARAASRARRRRCAARSGRT